MATHSWRQMMRPVRRTQRTAAFRDWSPDILVVLAAVLIRLPGLGDPNYHLDEHFYLLVGQHINDGALPYVDIWDRKPLGLFLIYALIAATKGGIISVQLAAMGAAAGTAVLLARIARRFVTAVPATLAAITYLAALEALAGGGGQSPVFYNLLVTGMALLALRARDALDLRRVRRLAAAAMTLGGIALTIKQTTIVEALFFGLLMTWQAWRITRTLRATLREAALFAAIGAAPTLACLGWYWLLGHADSYIFATLTSAALRTPITWNDRAALALYLLPRVVPLLLTALAGAALIRREADGPVLAGWIAAAIVGFGIVPNFYDHYALALLPSLCVASAVLFARIRSGPFFAVALIATSLALAGWPALRRAAAARVAMDTLVVSAAANGGSGSLYVFDGPPQLYSLLGAPLPTRWTFPEHLSTSDEIGATGAPNNEVERILSNCPAVIVSAVRPLARRPNPDAWRLVTATLASSYVRVAVIDLSEFAGTRPIGVWALRIPHTCGGTVPNPAKTVKKLSELGA